MSLFLNLKKKNSSEQSQSCGFTGIKVQNYFLMSGLKDLCWTEIKWCEK